MTDLTDRLDEIEARADAATPGPWEADVTEVSQHWSRPEPWATVVSSEVNCMAYCYGGIGRGIERETDAEFIAAARTDMPALVAALRAVLELHHETRVYELDPAKGTWVYVNDERVVMERVCAECSDIRTLADIEDGVYQEGSGVAWPCPTVRAIAKTLGADHD